MPLWKPTNIEAMGDVPDTKLVCWYSSKDSRTLKLARTGEVIYWQDRSKNNNVLLGASGKRPTLTFSTTGKPQFTFDGSDDTLTTAAEPSGWDIGANNTWWMTGMSFPVADDPKGSNAFYAVLAKNANDEADGDDPPEPLNQMFNSSGSRTPDQWRGKFDLNQDSAEQFTTAGDITPEDDKPFLFETMRVKDNAAGDTSADDGEVFVYFNGADYSAGSDHSTGSLTTEEEFRVASLDGGAGAKISTLEIVVYTRGPSTSQYDTWLREELEGYIAHSMGIQNDLRIKEFHTGSDTNNHPYRFGAPTCGHSVSAQNLGTKFLSHSVTHQYELNDGLNTYCAGR